MLAAQLAGIPLGVLVFTPLAELGERGFQARASCLAC